MTPSVLHRADYTTMAWANGGGVTHEIARHPAAPGTDWVWRVSSAEVAASGPFSKLPGVDRVLLLLDGTVLRLTIDGERVDLPRLTVLRFAGEADTSCEVPRPSRDVNVMTRRGAARADVDVVAATAGPVGGHDGVLLIVAVDAPAVLTDHRGRRHELADGDTLRADDGHPLHADGAGYLVVIRIAT